MNEQLLKELREKLAIEALGLNVFKINNQNPFQWASGYMMPVYNDNRILLNDAITRNLVLNLLKESLLSIKLWNQGMFAGVATAGIPWAALFAQQQRAKFIYVRDKAKDHGMKNQIEGIPADEGLDGKSVIVVEDLISTGGSTKKAIEAVRQAGGDVKHCISIFDYGFPESAKLFEEINCKLISLITFEDVWQTALKANYLTEEQVAICADWQKDPWGWGEKNGFPKVEKK